MRTLPVELIDHILGFLSADIDVLKECSLVVRSWAPLAQRRIFHEVELPLPGIRMNSQRCSTFIALLQTTSSHISRYVRSVRILIAPQGGGEASTQVVQAIHQICLLLSYFEQPRSVFIFLRGVPRLYTPEFETCLQNLVSQPTLKFASFVTCGWAPTASLLSHCVHVRHLTIDISLAYALEFNDESPALEFNLECLETLTIRYGDIPTQFTFIVPNLREFSRPISWLKNPPPEGSALAVLPPNIPSSVVHLELAFEMPDYPLSYYYPHLPILGTYFDMRRLTMVVYLRPFSRKSREAVLQAVNTFLFNAPPKNLLRLEDIVMRFIDPMESTEVLQDVVSDSNTWPILDACLMVIVRLGHLKSILFEFQYPTATGGYDQVDAHRVRVSKFVQERLPELSNSGILKIEVRIDRLTGAY